MNSFRYLLVAAGMAFSCLLSAQIVVENRMDTFMLSDSISVTLAPGYDPDNRHTYYYFPTHFRLAEHQNGTPAFSLITFEGGDGYEGGAILNFMLTWGLTTEQELAADSMLKNIDTLGVLAGPVPVETPEAEASFRISGDNELARLLRERLRQPLVAATLPGSKMALSYRLNEEETRILQEGMQSKNTLQKISFELMFTFRGLFDNKKYQSTSGKPYTLRKNLLQLWQPITTPKTD